MDKVTLLDKAIRLADTAEKYQKPRFDEISKNEEAYYNKVVDPLPGYFNVPLAVTSGFVETLLSRVMKGPAIEFTKTDDSDSLRAKKITAMWRKDSAPDSGGWDFKDLLAKKEATMSGRAIFKIYSESDPKYKNHLDVIHYKDFFCEPRGGVELENHLFCGVKNIQVTIEYAKRMVENGYYEKECLEAFSNDETKIIQDDDQNRDTTAHVSNLDPESFKYIGTNVLNLYEECLTTDDGRYYILFDKPSKICFRWKKLTEMFPDNEYPFKSWATHPDNLLFWSKAPADEIRPVGDAINTIFNQGLNNLQKRNFPQRAFDTSIFTDPTFLNYIPNGLVPAKSMGGNLANGIFTFETPDNSTLTINLIQFLDSFTGQKSGITPGSQGAASEQAVGIYYGNMEQVAKRLGPMNLSYRNCYVSLAKAWKSGLSEHLNEKEMIQYIGVEGIRWDEIRKEDIKTKKDLQINVIDVGDSIQKEETDRKKKIEGLAILTNNPTYSQQLNSKFVINEILKASGYSQNDIIRALDLTDEADEESLARASEAIEEILEGKKPELYLNADKAFVTKLINYAKNTDIPIQDFVRIMEYAQQHIDIAQKSENTKALNSTPVNNENGLSVNNAPGLTDMNIPNPSSDPSAIQERSQKLTQQI